MERPWIAERSVDAGLALALLGEAFPDLSVDRMERFGEGWDNVAYLVNGELVFRFPQRTLAGRCMEDEIAVLPALRDRLPLAIPILEWIGRSGAHPWPFAGYRMLHGTTACRANLDADARARAAEPLADFLRALHACDAPAPPDSLGRLDLSKRIPQDVARLRASDLFPDRDRLISVVEAFSISRAVDRSTLVHGDLYVRHLLFDHGRITGVIDWGDVHRGDRASDLAIAYAFLPPHARERFFARYGDVDADTHALARYGAIHIGIAIAVYGREIGDADLVREGLYAVASGRAS